MAFPLLGQPSSLKEPDIVYAFINRWSRTESADRNNAAPFMIELCDLFGLDQPEPATGDLAQCSGLLFERFISAERHEPPDIDVDFESDYRE